jgi:hypothetical protein
MGLAVVKQLLNAATSATAATATAAASTTGSTSAAAALLNARDCNGDSALSLCLQGSKRLKIAAVLLAQVSKLEVDSVVRYALHL